MKHRTSRVTRALLLTVTATVAAAQLAACGGDSNSNSAGSSPSKETIKVAYVGALSGPVGASGRIGSAGLKAGVEYANKQGIAKFEYVERDSGGDPSKGANLARELAQSGVKAIFAGTTDFAAIQPVANQYHVLVADSGGVTGVLDKLGTSHEFPWGFCPDTACGSPTVLSSVNFLYKLDKNATIGELNDTTAYGSGTSTYVDSLVKKQFPSLKMVKQSFPPTATSVVSQLTDLKNQGANTLLLWTYGAPLVMVMQSLDSMGWYPNISGPLGFGDPSVVAATPEKLKGKVFAGGIAKTQVADSPGASATGLNKKFFDTYTKIAGVKDYNGLDTVASYAFDWVLALQAAVKGTNSTDTTKMRDWLTAGHQIETTEGTQKFGKDGEQRIGVTLDMTTVYDPSYSCAKGVCVAPKVTA